MTKSYRGNRVMVKIVLACGHTIRVRNKPFDPRATFHCPMNTGCGYALRWLSYCDEGAEDHVLTNPDLKGD